jgi:hypothetical protein
MPTQQLSKSMCDDLKAYLDLKLAPLAARIDEVDRRDAEQFKVAQESLIKRAQTEKDVDIVRMRVNEFKEQMAVNTSTIQQSLNSMHEKIDKVQNTVDNVKANGRKGLNESIADIYSEIKTIKDDQSHNISHSPAWKFLSNKRVSKVMWILILYFLVQTVAHLLGYDINILNILVRTVQ